VLGTVYAAYRQNVGTPRDLANPRYQELRKELLNTLQSNPGVVYAAAHDYSLQLTPFEGNYHLVAGSFAESRTSAPGGSRCTAGAKKVTPGSNTLPTAR
jgi:hypothetical protein